MSTRIPHPLLPVFILTLAALFGLVAACADDSDASAISTRLADALTDALDFEGSDVVDEPPPPVGTASEEARITSLIAPETLTLGDPFQIEVTTDWPTPEDINMAVVWVKGSSRHIWVTRDIYPEGASFTADIGGVLAEVPELAGKTFTVAVSLQIHSTTSGEYVDWTFTVADSETANRLE